MPGKDIAKEIDATLRTLTQGQTVESDIAETISLIFSQSNDIEYLRKKSIGKIKDKLIAAHAEASSKLSADKASEAGVDAEILLEEIDKFIDSAFELHGMSKRKYFDISTINSKKNLKKLIQNFAIYEIYKVMNPRRIAGETKKMNYINNLMYGGKKLASKYEGGTKSDLKSYGKRALDHIHRAVGRVKKISKGFSR